MRGLAKRAIRFYPILKDIHVIRAYAGLRPYAEDHFPIISDVPEVPGFYIAAGHEGNGIGLAPITGKLICGDDFWGRDYCARGAAAVSRFKK